jgi:hypothetical protein
MLQFTVVLSAARSLTAAHGKISPIVIKLARISTVASEVRVQGPSGTMIRTLSFTHFEVPISESHLLVGRFRRAIRHLLLDASHGLESSSDDEGDHNDQCTR